MKKEIGIIGLGKMGGNMARRLLEKDWKVHGYARHADTIQKLARNGMRAASSPAALVDALPSPRVVILMVPARPSSGAPRGTAKPVDEVLFGKEGIAKFLSKGDIVIDAGNSYFEEDAPRAKKLAKRGIKFMDVGFSGGPHGARRGGCLMIGGDKATFTYLKPLFKALAQHDGYQFFKGVGAGHFVKMVHNGIEYGMMQAIAEGFNLMKKSKFKPDLLRVTDIYQHGSVVESRLVGWLKAAYEWRGVDLKNASSTVGHLGEGEWTIKTAKKMKVPVKVIEESLKFRLASAKNPSYAGKVLTALREQFGGPRTKVS